MIELKPLIYDKEMLNRIASERNKVLQNLRSTWVTEPEKQREWIMNMNPDTERYFYVFDMEAKHIIDNDSFLTIDNEFIGYCGLDKINHIDSYAEVSLLIFEEHRKKGIGIKAMKKLLKYGFDYLGLHLLYVNVNDIDNIFEFWEKIGFQKEGNLKFRKKIKYLYCDVISASLCKSDWKLIYG